MSGRYVTFTHVVRVMGEFKRRFVTVDLDDRGPLSCLVTLDGMLGALVTVSPDQRYRLRKRARQLEATFADVPTLPVLPNVEPFPGGSAEETHGSSSYTVGE